MCFKYCNNSKYEELDIDQLKDISCIHSVPATLVVTAISYGADAVFAYCKSMKSEKKLLHL